MLNELKFFVKRKAMQQQTKKILKLRTQLYTSKFKYLTQLLRWYFFQPPFWNWKKKSFFKKESVSLSPNLLKPIQLTDILS